MNLEKNCHVDVNHRQGNRRYQTSPAMCNPTTPFAADKRHCLRPEIFRILFALAWHTEWSLLQRRCSDRCSEDCQCFQMPGQPLKIAVSFWEICTPIYDMVPWAHPSLRPKRHVDRFSRFFAQRTVECPITLQWADTFFPKIAPSP